MQREIKKYHFKEELDFQIEILRLDTLLASNKEFLFTPHRTDFYHIFLFEQCSPKHVVDFVPIQIEPNSLLFLTKERVHQFDPSARYDGKVLIFTDDFFCTSDKDAKFLKSTILFNDLIDKPDIFAGSAIHSFLSLCDAIDEELKVPNDSVKHSLLKNYLHNLLLLAEREKRSHGFTELKKGADLDYTILFRDLLEERFTISKSVAEYSVRMNLSEKRLSKATAQVLGKTPKEMIDERVMLEAKRLIVHDVQSIKEIGFALGFEEPAYFVKYFRKHSGKTPAAFRASFLTPPSHSAQ